MVLRFILYNITCVKSYFNHVATEANTYTYYIHTALRIRRLCECGPNMGTKRYIVYMSLLELKGKPKKELQNAIISSIIILFGKQTRGITLYQIKIHVKCANLICNVILENPLARYGDPQQRSSSIAQLIVRKNTSTVRATATSFCSHTHPNQLHAIGRTT
jgi:hypothetical protein